MALLTDTARATRTLLCPRCQQSFQTRRAQQTFCSQACATRDRRYPNRRRQPLEERFWSKVHLGTEDDCWIWLGSRNESGYGTFSIRHATTDKAHRVAYRLAFGDFPRELDVLHTCDRPPCVNPKHLYLGTAKDNAHDSIERGRFFLNRYPLRGNKNGHAKLTAEAVVEIRRLYSGPWSRGEQGSTKLAVRFGVSVSHLRKVAKGERGEFFLQEMRHAQSA